LDRLSIIEKREKGRDTGEAVVGFRAVELQELLDVIDCAISDEARSKQ
jgi:hypothetical protein